MAKKTKKLMTPKWTSASVRREFGPLKKIDRRREGELLDAGEWKRILTLIECDGYYELTVGHHLVNVDEIFETAKEMPEDLIVPDNEVWYGEDGLPA